MYDLKAEANDGSTKSLSDFKGKVVLIVNTASECGYTPQYKGLQELHQKYQGQGFTVLGVPSNDFGAQEPGSNADIKKFCELKYKTTFPLLAKVPVKGAAKAPLFQWLTKGGDEVKWNFEKFLVGRDGKLLGRFKSDVDPMAPNLVKAVETALG